MGRTRLRDSIVENARYKDVTLLDSSNEYTINTGSEYIEIMSADMTTAALGLWFLDISTIAGAQAALDPISAAVNTRNTVTEDYESNLNSLQIILSTY